MFHLFMDVDPSKLEGDNSVESAGGYEKFVNANRLTTKIGAQVFCESIPLKIPEKLLFRFTMTDEGPRSMCVVEQSDETSMVDALIASKASLPPTSTPSFVPCCVLL